MKKSAIVSICFMMTIILLFSICSFSFENVLDVDYNVANSSGLSIYGINPFQSGEESRNSSYNLIRSRSIISIEEDTVDLNEGETLYLHATCSIPGATISWISNNSSVATVNNSGLVTAIKAHTAAVYITAYVLDGTNLYLADCYVYVKIPDGTYYFRNESSGLCADATQYSVGSEVLQWMLHGGANQKWLVTYLSNGVYSIKNGMSNLFLGVESLNSTAAKTTQYSVLSDLSKWYIAKTSSGAYCLYAKGNLSYGYVIGSALSGNTNGTAITNTTYTNNSNYQDEWALDRIQWNYVNYYDSSFANSSGLVSKIQGANTFSGIAFTNQFGLTIGTQSTSRKYDILCDQCTTGTDDECDDSICGDDCGSDHHKNYHRISNQLYNPSLHNIITCLWTNRGDGTYCYENENNGAHTCVQGSIVALVAELGRPVIQFCKISTTDKDTPEALMGINLVHETAHTFGLPEQNIPTYPIPNPGYNTHNDNYYCLNGYVCVMMKYHPDGAVEFYNEIKAGHLDAFCTNCSNYLMGLIDD